MLGITKVTNADGSVTIQDPPIAQFLFGNSKTAIVWLIIRLYVGYEWLEAGWHKVTDPAWMNGGGAILSYWQRAVAVPAPPARAPISYDWFRDFLNLLIAGQAQTWMGPLVAVGEVAVGLGLIVGAFVGVAAFFGAFMNMNFMLAGSASTNPVLFFLAVLLMLGWKVAGYWGLDRVLLPLLGTPWQSKQAITAPAATPPSAPAAQSS
jgi:thiosulfate dehydrogenase [quinone] large subunit